VSRKVYLCVRYLVATINVDIASVIMQCCINVGNTPLHAIDRLTSSNTFPFLTGAATNLVQVLHLETCNILVFRTWNCLRDILVCHTVRPFSLLQYEEALSHAFYGVIQCSCSKFYCT
jgi:hypothetical protein